VRPAGTAALPECQDDCPAPAAGRAPAAGFGAPASVDMVGIGIEAVGIEDG